MKKLALTAGIILSITSGAAMAHGEFTGYLLSATDGSLVRDGNGNCIKTPNSTIGFDATECTGQMAAAPAAPAEPKEVTRPVFKKFALYFDFNSSEVGGLANIVDYIKSLSYLEGVKLVGHADPIGSDEYNQALSLKRAQNTAAALKEAGVTDWKLGVDAQGEKAPMANCTGKGAQLIACLRPDRRVDVEVTGEITEKQM
ncbi:OmpA family protein [Marinobacterium sp. LSUCC0821]|jgi:OOP family OmpA-OmpF porin|uniref:OmpA family protein n=1 Tax=Marinobacterium sp. LSUCC0821 TaxID=2668067 RepID=UPI0014515E42|nr:OmpA family protein [Marinobacterium sp. LSUCC0821]QJD71331.1 OmpA family protein [Marinobacterium sp. LSUCC0821]